MTVTTGLPFAVPNQFGFGFTLKDLTKVSALTYGVADTVTIPVRPLAVNALSGGLVLPKESKFRIKFPIESNTADTITVKIGSKMLDDAAKGDVFRVEAITELASGYDGIADIGDINFLDGYDTGTSPLKSLRGKNLGLVKLATPAVTAIAVQKAGVAFVESQNWQYRYEFPANIVSETAAEEFLNESLGRNDFAVVSFPSFGKATSPSGQGLKLITQTGAIHGMEASFARNFLGFHKAAAGLEAKLPGMLARPDGLEELVLDEEFLNPLGISVLKKLDGNFVVWGSRTAGIDPAFKFKHQREFVSHVENVFLENFDFIIFALNNTELLQQLKSAFVVFFTPELAKGSIVGNSLSDAVVIKLDAENNTPETQDAGDTNAEIGMRVVGMVERFIIKVSKLGITEGT